MRKEHNLADSPSTRAPAPSHTGAEAGPPSFDALYRSHYRRVYGLCRQMLRREDQAEDAAQEVFVRAYRAFSSYDPAQPFAAWVLSIAANHCVDIVRRRAKERQIFGAEQAEASEIESDEPGAVAALVSAENAKEINTAVERLPDKYRIPLVLAYYNEASYDEIAATLGVTRNHVGVLILRAKQSLRRSLGTASKASGEAQ